MTNEQIDQQLAQLKHKKKCQWLWKHGYSLTSLPLKTVQKMHNLFPTIKGAAEYLIRTKISSEDFNPMSFLHDYLYHAEGNECPDQFHVCCAYTVLSAAISRRVWMSLEDSEIFCNIFTLLVGDAGNGKSWALNKAKRMMTEMDLPISGDKETPEGLLRFMAGDPNASKPVQPYGGAGYCQLYQSPKGIPEEVYPMNIIASEFVDFIKTDDIGWINILNNIFDAPSYSYKTKNQGNDLLHGPYITLLGGLTTQISSSMQKDAIINTGLARRTLFQYGERKWHDPKALPEFNQAHQDARARCISHLRAIQKVHGPFILEGEVREWYVDWYNNNSRLVPTRNPTVRSWYASKSTQVLKLGMLTSLSERLDRVLEVKHFQTALDYLEILENDLYRIFGGVGKNDLTELALKIFNHLTLMPSPVEYFKIKTAFFRDVPGGRKTDEALTEVLNFLVNDGKIKAANIGIQVNGQHVPAASTIYATPECLEAWVADQRSAGVVVERSLVTANGLPTETADVVDPSSVPLPNLNEKIEAEALTSVLSPSDTATFVPPMLVKRPQTN